jgi:integrase
MRKFYLHRRAGIWYAELVNDGIKLNARSTGTTSRDEALLKVADWLKNGIPEGTKRRSLDAVKNIQELLKILKTLDIDESGAMAVVSALKQRGLLSVEAVPTSRSSQKAIPFMLKFWDYDKSPYIQDRIAHGHPITKKYCYKQQQEIIHHWQPVFDGKSLGAITRENLRDLSTNLFKEGLAPKSINNTLASGLKALKWAYGEGIISSDPGDNLERYAGVKQKREVLTEEETERLFAVDWPDKMAYTACLLACTAGLRNGEIRALRKDDIKNTVLDISHGWNNVDGLKTPKNGEERRTPLLPEVKTLLLKLLDESPWKKLDNPFIFYSAKPDRPCGQCRIIRGLRKALKAARIDTTGRKIDVHSFRHYYASRMADVTTPDKVARVTGHKSKAVAEHYQAHITEQVIDELGADSEQVFGGILEKARETSGLT